MSTMLNNPPRDRLGQIAARLGKRVRGFWRNETGYVEVLRIVWGCVVRVHLRQGRLDINLRVQPGARRHAPQICQQAIEGLIGCFDPGTVVHQNIAFDRANGAEHIVDAGDLGTTQERVWVDVTDQDVDTIMAKLNAVRIELAGLAQAESIRRRRPRYRAGDGR